MCIQQEFNLCAVETVMMKAAWLGGIISLVFCMNSYGKWLINKELINHIGQQQSW